MVCFDNVQKHNLYITCLINKKKSEAYKDSFKSKQNMINSLPAFTNYTDIQNVLAVMKHQFRHDTVDCSIGKNGKGPLKIIFELIDGS